MNFNWRLGATIAFGAIFPLYGQIFGFPAIIIAGLFLVLAISIALERKPRSNVEATSQLVLLVGFIALVLLAARPEQWAYLSALPKWIHHSDNYAIQSYWCF